MSTFEQFIAHKKTLFVLGPGGVGKTTCSFALAVRATKIKKSVGLISIDPAKRLASAMGISEKGEMTELAINSAKLHSIMLDHQAIFDQMVMKYAENSRVAEQILEHKLYKIAKDKLSGTTEFMALALLVDMINNKKYDFVVIDTPPDNQAIEFLRSPNILHDFQQNRVISWFITPLSIMNKMGLPKLFAKSDKALAGLVHITGLSALTALAEFLGLMKNILRGFEQASIEMRQILKSQENSFFMVTRLDKSLMGANYTLQEKMTELGYSLDGIIINKILPKEVAENIATQQTKNSVFEFFKKRLKEEKICIEELEKWAAQQEIPHFFRCYDSLKSLTSLKAIEEFGENMMATSVI